MGKSAFRTGMPEMGEVSGPLFLSRYDGQPFDEDDDQILLEYSGFFALLVFWTECMWGPLTLVCEADQGRCFGLWPEAESEHQDITAAFATGHIYRVDGEPFTQEDDDAIMEFAGFMPLTQTLSALCDFDEGRCFGLWPSAYDEDALGGPSASMSEIQRVDGQPFTQEDEDALLEFAGFLPLVTTIAEICVQDEGRGFGLWPEPDEDMTAVGKELRANIPVDDDYEVACVPYGAFAVIGYVGMQIYRKMVGPLEDIRTMATNKSGKKSANKMKRTPSGGELNATLGLGVQSALGLSNPKRKVKVRNIL